MQADVEERSLLEVDETHVADAHRGRLALASLDQLTVAALILDRYGRLQHLNVAARNLFASSASARILDGRLVFASGAIQSRFAAALRRATELPPESSLIPVSAHGKVAHEVTVSPLEGNAAFVIIASSRPDAERTVQRVRRLFGLSDAEARVMAALAAGATVDEIGIKHGVRSSTVRAQVRSIFHKTGVNRQTDLVRLALGGAPFVVVRTTEPCGLPHRTQI